MTTKKELLVFCTELALRGVETVLVKNWEDECMLILVDEFSPPNHSGVNAKPFYTIEGRLPISMNGISNGYILGDETRLENFQSKTRKVKLTLPESVEFFYFEATT